MEETINTSSLTKSGTTFPEYISSINVQPILFEQQDEIGICEYTKIPLGKISAFGAAFASMLAPLQQITQTTSINMSGLYRAVDAGNNPILLKHMVNDGLGYATGYYENGLKTARMQPVSGVSSVQQLAMPFNPALMFMAISLMSVEKKLDDIQQTQIKILDFLKEDKRSELKGNITFLNDLLNNYKYNYDNDIYKNNMHVKVLDIKQSSEQNIEFYRNALKKSLSKRKLITSEDVTELKTNLLDYRTSIYLFGFSSFLEIMLLNNFNADYLNGVVKKMDEYTFLYMDAYSKSYELLEKSTKASVQSHALGALSGISNKAGSAIAKIPIISRGQIDETLVGVGHHLKSVKNDILDKTMQDFTNYRNCGISSFKENIAYISRVYNKPMDMIFDNNYIYFKTID